MNGFSITIIPRSWRLGRFDIRKKTLWAFGPLRFGLHRDLASNPPMTPEQECARLHKADHRVGTRNDGSEYGVCRKCGRGWDID